MKIYNKFVESKKEPYNKNDIWFDGKVFKVYKEGEWQAITLELEAADKIYEIIKDISNVYQEKLTTGDGISIKNNTISLETLYQLVDLLPKTGKTNTIYLVNSKNAELNNKLVEYIWINNTWEKLGEHKTEIKIPTPDWNAKEGEGGFIKNKPFRFITANGSEYKFKNSLKVEDFTPIYNEYNEIYLYKKLIDADGLQYVVCNKHVSSYGDIYETFFYPVPLENGKHRVNLGDYSGYVYTEVDDEGYYYLIVETDLSDTFFPENSVYVIDNYEDPVTVEMLPEGFLPPTTLKTTKQHLSSKDKKQVLTNLDLVDVARQKDVDKLNEETTSLWKDLKEGYHPNSTVGFSDDLVGRGESVPAEFSFRASGGKSIKDGTARIKRLKGNSVVWNQKARKYYLSQSANELRLDDGIPQGHIFLMTRTVATGELWYLPQKDLYQYYLNVGQYGKIMTCNHPEDKSFVRMYATADSGYAQLIDLTQMFGAGNEPTTIEEYNARKPIVADEYAFNEGEVIHMTAEGIKSIGDNAWDEEWELGTFNTTTGEDITRTDQIRSKNLIKILPNEQYHFGGNGEMWIIFYDANKNVIDSPSGASSGNSIYKAVGENFTTPSNAAYMKFYLLSNYGTTYNHDIMITLMHSGWKADTDAGYQPYWQDTLPLPIIRKYFPDGMKSAGSAHDEIRFNKASGKWEYTKSKTGGGKIKSVDLGTFDYDIGSTNLADSKRMRALTKISDAVVPANDAHVANILCSRYIAISSNDNWWNNEGVCIGADGYLYVYDKEKQDTASFKAAMQGVILYYESNDWEWVELDAEDQNFRDYYNVADFGTEEIIAEQPSAPLAADIIYQFNAVDMIREHELEIQELKKANNNSSSNNIDPVVWKYMCNPHIVNFDRTNTEFSNAIPKELSDIIYQNGEFNHLVLSTVLIKIYKELEGGDLFWRVERITSYDEDGNVVFDGEEFGYNPNTRLFLV